MIEFCDVCLEFEGQKVLQNINLHIEQGESFVLVGPSGEGKSVLLKLAAGLMPPTSGKIFVREKDIYALSDHDRKQLMLKNGMLFQKNALFDSLTVGENIGFPLKERTELSEQEIAKEIDKYLDAVGILHARDLYPEEISGGMQKRLGIARALALHPEIIFYDDPTAGLDPITSRAIIGLILQLKKERASTLMTVTNDMNRAYQMADRIAMVVEQELLVMDSVEAAKKSSEPRFYQFVRGLLEGPLTSKNNA